MKRCNCCNKEYANLKSLVESGKVIGTMRGPEYDLILVNCICNSTLAIKADDLAAELFKTKIG
jgi:hypothetical protein